MQIAIAQSESGDPNLEALKIRDEELRKRYEREWRAKFPTIHGMLWGRYNRGFVWHVGIKEPTRFAKQADAIFMTNPIISISMHWSAVVTPLIESSNIQRIRHFDHWVGPESLLELRQFYESEYCPPLRTLRWRFSFPQEGESWGTKADSMIELLAQCPAMSQLERFDMAGRHLGPGAQLTNTAAKFLLDSDHLTSLREVGFPQTSFSKATWRALKKRFEIPPKVG